MLIRSLLIFSVPINNNLTCNCTFHVVARTTVLLVLLLPASEVGIVHNFMAEVSAFPIISVNDDAICKTPSQGEKAILCQRSAGWVHGVPM